MASFFIYDISFLIIFTAFLFFFLSRKKKNIKREGLMYLYRTQLGVKYMDSISKRYPKTLHVLKYVSIVVGWILLILMLYLLIQTVYLYVAVPQITQLIKAPPVAPLIPYFPEIFGVQSYFPPFYFTYFLIALAIVAIVHEFSHGVFMRLFKIKINSTGFAFLGPILGAFVEEDKTQFQKKNNLQQLSVLSSGVFSNLIFSIIFFIILVGFFFLFFAPSGYIFEGYSMSIINKSTISNITSFNQDLNKITSGNSTYFVDGNLMKQFNLSSDLIIVYEDAPAVKVQLKGIITQIDSIKIKNQESLREFLISKNPGDNITIFSLENNTLKTFNLTLAENPSNNSIAYLGIASTKSVARGVVQRFILFITEFKDPKTYYLPRIDGGVVIFFYNLIWWIALINFFVALFNMLPIGILDGGRFFYLSMLSLTKSHKISNILSKIMTYLILFLFVFLMAFWFFKVI